MIPLIEHIYASKGLYQQLINPLCRKYDLTDSQVAVLLYVADPNPADTAAKIIKSQRLKKSLVSMSIDDLEKRGLLTSYYKEGDHKSKHLKVNEEARPIIEEALRIQEEYYALLTKGLSEKDKVTLNRCMSLVNMNISRYDS